MSSATDSPRLEEKSGMIAVAVAATISAVACSSLSLYIAFLFYQVKRSENKRWAPEVQLRTKFLRTQFGLLFMNLLLADLIQSIGFALNFHWVAQVGYIDETDSTCQTQAVAIEVGDVASALFALAISAHTACILAFRYKPPKWSVWVVIASIWALVITLTVIGPEALERSKDGQFYGNAGAWCWIAPAYQDERLYLHYLFVFISMFGSFTLYTLCGLALKQIWPFNRELAIIQRPPSVSGTQSSGSSGNQRGSRQDTVQMRDLPSFARLEKMARTMIFYPIVFSSLVLPLSVYRLAGMNGHKWSLKALCAAGFLYTTCGVADVIIFSLTRNIIEVKRHRKSGSLGSGNNRSGIHVHRIQTTFIDMPNAEDDLKSPRSPRSWKHDSSPDSWKHDSLDPDQQFVLQEGGTSPASLDHPEMTPSNPTPLTPVYLPPHYITRPCPD